MRDWMKNKFRSSKIERLLNNLDWDCSDNLHHPTSLSIVHWYPASFITSIPGNIIDIFTEVGDIVWDPFCGSGTSATEAFRKGRQFYGNDISKIAILITQAKLALIKHKNFIEKEFSDLRNKVEQADFDRSFNVLSNEYAQIGKSKCAYEDLKPWYHESTLNELLVLRGLLESSLKGKKLKQAFLSIFLSITKLACAQQKSWGHIADNVLPKADQIAARDYKVFSSFAQRLGQVQKQAQQLLCISREGSYHLKLADSRVYAPPSLADLVVTSPPYPNMADYVTSQRLDYYWLGYSKNDINEIKQKEIGPRYQRHYKDKGLNYSKEMKLSLTNIIESIKKNGTIVLILPDFDGNDDRSILIDDLYDYLKAKLFLLYMIPRNVDEMNRWSPFKTLKREYLSIWIKK